MKTIHQLAFTLAAALMLLSVNSQTVQAGIVVDDFDDIVLWTGSGSQQAAMVIDWADGKDPLVWGYRFDNATGADMLRDITQAHDNLFAKVEAFSFGWFVHGWGYDRDNDGFAITSGFDFGTDGFFVSSSTVPRNDERASDSDDSYRETDANFVNSWAYWNATGTNYPGASWASAAVGVSDRALTNNSWDGFQFNTLGFGNEIAPATAFAAVPEPTALSLMPVALAILVSKRRRRA